MNIEALLEGKRIAICAGPGGVGKTTCAAAVAAAVAAGGRKVCVVTIDPARRLADALGLKQLGNEPTRVDPARLGAGGEAGELWALMLDPKQTLDGLIARIASDEQAREDVLTNRIYQQLSNAVAGSQEFTAIAKLYELDQSHAFDLLVLDTPPSRNALDFLDAPDRLTGFFQGRAIRLFLRPAGLSSRVLGGPSAAVFGLLRRVTGIHLLDDLRGFFAALAGMIDAIVERSNHVKALLSDSGTAFLLVTSPEPEPVEETVFFHTRLIEQGLPFAGLIVNRVRPPLSAADAGELEAASTPLLGAAAARRAGRGALDAAALSTADAEGVARLRAELDDPPTLTVAQLDSDVDDLAGLAHVRAALG